MKALLCDAFHLRPPRARSAALLLAPAIFAALGAAASEVRVHWRDAWYSVAELPGELAPPARAAVVDWADWAEARHARLELDADGRVLLVTASRDSRLARERELVTATTRLFDRLLPAPERVARAAPEEPPPGASDPGGLPEDPEEGTEGGEPARKKADSAWGSDAHGLDVQTILLFVLKDEEAQGALLDRLAARAEHLRAWAQGARALTGFVLEDPLCGAFLLAAEGQKEWDPDNELVNRLAQLLVLRRFGREPHWLVQGFAWHVEERVCGAIYCFPHRTGFVGIGEHSGWDKSLARRFKALPEKPVEAEDFALWRRGSYDEETAHLSWGLVSFLIHDHPEQLPAFAEALRRFRDEHNRVPREAGGWERDPAYEVPPGEQARLLRESFGEKVLLEAAYYFRTGMPAAAKRER